MTDRTDKPASSKAGINETSRRCRRVLDDEFKAKVVLEALKEERTLNELAARYDLHPNQISQWKNQFVKNASMVFGGPKHEIHEIEQLRAERDELHKRIGEKDMDIEFLKKNCKKLGLI
jgi:transposase